MGRRRILLVDDDPLVLEVLTLFLNESHEVEHATTGREALAMLRHESIALVVLEHRLPDWTGLDVLTELKSMRPDLPVIMLTGYGSEWICASAFKLGVRDYFPKPVSGADLAGAVDRILSVAADAAGYPPGVPGAARRRPAAADVAARGPDFSIEKAIGLIQQRYWDRLSLGDIARGVGMSKHRLSHRFREVLGVTFRDYLTRVRLERAKALLTAGRASITEVAQSVGFGDLARFDKLFKRYTGLTPSAYRRQAPTGSSN